MKKVTLILFLLCAYLSNAQLKDGTYTIKNIEDNTEYQDFGATFYGDSTVVFSSSRRVNTIIANIWAVNKMPYLRTYQGIRDADGEITEVEEFAKGVNTKFHDANIRFTKDLQTVYFTSNNYLNKKFKKDTLGFNLNQLYRAERKSNGDWTNVTPMPFNNDNYQTGHPALSPDETKLYFISDMPGGLGLTDIYVVDILEDGTYGTPVNLGPKVNTAGKEMFPYVSEDNELYFSSDGYAEGKGGLDIYVNKMVDNELQESVNLQSPLNSEADDFSLVYKTGENIGYFASNRAGGKGDDDIYFFRDLRQIISGSVVDSVTGEPIEGAEVVLYDEAGAQLASVTAKGAEATFSFEQKSDNFYKLIANKTGYSEDTEGVFLEPGKDANVLLEIVKDIAVVEKPKVVIKINPIYFDFDKSDIRPDAALELDKVVAVMNANPLINVEGGSHTDRRGDDAYNLALSERRAKSTIDYLISKGISADRLTSKGYGETEPINKCDDASDPCDESDHDINRRTEFVVLNPDNLSENTVIEE